MHLGDLLSVLGHKRYYVFQVTFVKVKLRLSSTHMKKKYIYILNIELLSFVIGPFYVLQTLHRAGNLSEFLRTVCSIIKRPH